MTFVYEKSERQILQSIPQAEELQPEASFGEVYTAAFRHAVNEEMSISGGLNREGYRQRQREVKRLIDEGEITNVDDYTNQMGELDYHVLSQSFDTIKSDEQLAEERNTFLAAEREKNQEVMERGSGVAQFLGYASAFVIDPINLATLPVSTAVTGARSLSWIARGLSVAKREGALSIATELAIQPLVYEHKKNIDSPSSWQDAVSNIGIAAIGSYGVGFATGGLAGYLKAVRTKTEPFIDPVRDDMAMRSLDDLADYVTKVEAQRFVPSKILDDEYGKLISKEYDSLAKLKRQTVRELEREIKATKKQQTTILRMIADMGGLSQKDWVSQGVDPGYFTKTGAIRKGMRPGSPLFRAKGGMTPEDLAERLMEENVFTDGLVDDNRAIDYVHAALADPEKPFNLEASTKLEDLQRRLQELNDAPDDDALEAIYKRAGEERIQTNLETLRELEVNLQQMNVPSRSEEFYFDPKPAKVAAQSVSERERMVLDKMGIADEYDEAMEAYQRTENRVLWDEAEGTLVDADAVMKEIDDEIAGLDDVLRCTIGG